MSPAERPGGLGKALHEVLHTGAAGETDRERLASLFGPADHDDGDRGRAALTVLGLLFPADVCVCTRRLDGGGAAHRVRAGTTDAERAWGAALGVTPAARLDGEVDGLGLAVVRVAGRPAFSAEERRSFDAVLDLTRGGAAAPEVSAP